MAKKGKQEEPENLERWLVSYADFMTLLMAFFVVMYSLSSINEGKYRVASDSIQQAFSNIRSSVRTNGSSEHAIFDRNSSILPHPPPKSELKSMLSKLAKRFAQSSGKGEEAFEVFEDYRGLVLRIGEEGMFDSGRAELKPSAFAFLEDLGLLARQMPSTLEVEAHTDDRPIVSSQFHSNWELSALRATATVDFLIRSSGMPPERLKAIGRGDSVPAVPNTSERGRLKNRRVEFVFTEPVRRVDAPTPESPAAEE